MKVTISILLGFLFGAMTIMYAQDPIGSTTTLQKKVTTEVTEVKPISRPPCKILGTGEYDLHKIITSRGKSNIKYSGTKQSSSNYKLIKDKVSLKAGESFTLEIVQSNNWSRTMVWIDWNKDGNFQGDDELMHVFGLGSQLNPGPFSGRIHVPESMTKGVYIMRMISGDSWTYDEIPENACGELFNSSIKDITVKIL